MASGPFVNVRYAAAYGGGTNVHPIRIQPETLGAVFGAPPVTNVAPGAAVTSPISAKVSGSKRSIGLNTRKLSLKFSGTPPAGYLANATITIPWLQPFPASFAKGVTGTYLGVAAIIVSLSPEYVK